jgi:hypothetical protein
MTARSARVAAGANSAVARVAAIVEIAHAGIIPIEQQLDLGGAECVRSGNRASGPPTRHYGTQEQMFGPRQKVLHGGPGYQQVGDSAAQFFPGVQNPLRGQRCRPIASLRSDAEAYQALQALS